MSLEPLPRPPTPIRPYHTCSYNRRKKEMIDREREWMADKPNWVVNRSFFFTQRQERPSFDPVDPRTMTPWSPTKVK